MIAGPRRRALFGLAFAALSTFALMATAGPARAHRLAPSFLSLREAASGEVTLLWKTPRVVARGARVRPLLPEQCRALEEPGIEVQQNAFLERARLRCPEGLSGAWIGAEGLEESGTDVLVHVALADGSERRTILSREAPRWQVPAAERPSEVALSYGWLGVEHLVTGLDHVLFVAGLVFLVQGGRRLVGAITAFTAGHSLTLVLAILGFVALPPALTEIGIAASLVVLAGELVRLREGDASALARRPWIMAFGFGLLHGLGFAGALAELGLPSQAIPLALFAFNVGIELGQLALIVPLLPLALLARRAGPRAPTWLAELPATAIGSLGVFWCLERSLGWFTLG